MNSRHIYIKDVTDTALSNADGVRLELAISKELAKGNSITISFSGINTVSSSFLNSSIGNIIDKFGFNILSKIKLVDYTSSIATFVKKYISDIKSWQSC